VIDVELAHPFLPVHMGIEQSRNNEFSAQIEHLHPRRRGGVRGSQIANDIPLDQQRAIPEGRIGESVYDSRPSDEKRRRRLRLAACQGGKRENSGDKNGQKNGSNTHLDLLQPTRVVMD
jgi:hypothetical protein